MQVLSSAVKYIIHYFDRMFYLFLRDFKLLLATRKDPLRDYLRVHVVGERGIRESFGVNPDHFFIGRLAGKLTCIHNMIKFCIDHLDV